MGVTASGGRSKGSPAHTNKRLNFFTFYRLFYYWKWNETILCECSAISIGSGAAFLDFAKKQDIRISLAFEGIPVTITEIRSIHVATISLTQDRIYCIWHHTILPYRLGFPCKWKKGAPKLMILFETKLFLPKKNLFSSDIEIKFPLCENRKVRSKE